MPRRKLRQSEVPGVTIDENIPNDLSLMVNREYGLTAHMVEMARWDYAKEAHHLMDSGYSPKVISKFYEQKGFPVEETEVAQYMAIRKRVLLNNLTMERLIASSIRTPAIKDKSIINVITTPDVDTSFLRNELDAVDAVIQKGYKTLVESDDPVSPSLMLQAIKLKHDLTGGMLGGFTNYGLAELREIENQKSTLMMEHMMKYIAPEMRKQIVQELLQLEDDFYSSTPYYEMYLRSRQDLSPAEIEAKLREADSFQHHNVEVVVHRPDTTAEATRNREADQKVIVSFLKGLPERERKPNVTEDSRPEIAPPARRKYTTGGTAILKVLGATKRGELVDEETLALAEKTINTPNSTASKETRMKIRDMRQKLNERNGVSETAKTEEPKKEPTKRRGRPRKQS